jgi:hypothetical protein
VRIVGARGFLGQYWVRGDVEIVPILLVLNDVDALPVYGFERIVAGRGRLFASLPAAKAGVPS